MEQERPEGWRPFSEEYRATLRGSGFSDAQIAEMEATNIYSPIPSAVWALELGIAILHGMGKRLGPEFAKDVRFALDRRANKLKSSPDGENRIDGRILDDFLAEMDWESIIARASDPDWTRELPATSAPPPIA